MKDYEHVVIWLDYFNKNLKKSKGRKLGLEKCVFDPSLKELMDATKAAGFEITEHDEKVRFPKRPFVGRICCFTKRIPRQKFLTKFQKNCCKRSKQSK